MSSNCHEIIELMSLRLDGELGEAEIARLDAHISSCAACAQAWAEMRETHGILREHLLRETEDAARADRAAEGTINRLREEPDPTWLDRPRPASPIRPFWRRWSVSWRLAAGLAAATAAVLLALRVAPGPTVPERIAPPAWTREQTEKPAGTATEKTERETAREGEPTKHEGPYVLGGGADIEVRPSRGATEAPAEPSAEEALEDLQASEAPIEPPDQVRTAPIPEIELDPVEPPSRDAGVKTRQEKKAEPAPQEFQAPPQQRITSLNEGSGATHMRGGRADETAINLQPKGAGVPAGAIDTTGSTAGLRGRLDAERSSLLAEFEGVAASDAATRADLAGRLRTLGDLWEWLGRREESPSAFARALELYDRARALDAGAADLDTTRVRRARTGSRQTGNTKPPRR